MFSPWMMKVVHRGLSLILQRYCSVMYRTLRILKALRDCQIFYTCSQHVPEIYLMLQSYHGQAAYLQQHCTDISLFSKRSFLYTFNNHGALIMGCASSDPQKLSFS